MIWAILVPLGIIIIIAGYTYLPKEFTPLPLFGVIAVWVLTGLVQTWWTSVRRHLVWHLGGNLRSTETVSVTVFRRERPDLQIAFDHLRKQADDLRPLGVENSISLASICEKGALRQSVKWERFPRSLTEQIDCAENAIYRLRLPNGKPFIAAIITPYRPYSRYEIERSRPRLEVAAKDIETARAGLELIQETARKLSIYRGTVVTIDRATSLRDDFTVRFIEFPAVSREAIILPEALLHAVERSVLSAVTHADLLRRTGRGVRRGILLHGPPGTGKTLVTRYLASQCKGFTIVTISGRQQLYVRQACLLARLLAPSLVILEDVDLIASDRTTNRRTIFLHELMDEIDALGPNTETVFLLTTNRPHLLERALMARPGRVDQAIEFPLPDAECRRRLLAWYSRGVDLSRVDVERLVDRLAGASPAFIQELLRKAVLAAAERGSVAEWGSVAEQSSVAERGSGAVVSLEGEQTRPLVLDEADFNVALRELLELGGELTRNFLGFPVPPARAVGA